MFGIYSGNPPSYRRKDVESSYIIPFVKSVQNVFNTMLQMEVDVDSPKIKPPGKSTDDDISGIISLSGDVERAVAVSFPYETGKQVVAKFVGEELATDHEDFADAIGELVNMVTGGAKVKLEENM